MSNRFLEILRFGHKPAVKVTHLGDYKPPAEPMPQAPSGKDTVWLHNFGKYLLTDTLPVVLKIALPILLEGAL